MPILLVFHIQKAPRRHTRGTKNASPQRRRETTQHAQPVGGCHLEGTNRTQARSHHTVVVRILPDTVLSVKHEGRRVLTGGAREVHGRWTGGGREVHGRCTGVG